MRASRRRSHHSIAASDAGVKRPCIANPSACSAASAASTCPMGNPAAAASAEAISGPEPSRRPRTSSMTALSVVHWPSCESGTAAADAETASGNNARNKGRRSTAIQIDRVPVSSRVTRRCAASSPSNSAQPDCRSTSDSVRNVSHNSASCSSSAFAASGHASSRTRWIASGSSLPRSDALSGSSQRRLMTAWVRRSSSGASSRYAYGRADRTSSASGDGSVKSRATTAISPVSRPRSNRSKPSTSIASSRQSRIVWRTSG